VFVQRHEREIEQKLEEQEETALNITETYNSLQQEVEIKTKKLKKVKTDLYCTLHDCAEYCVYKMQFTLIAIL